MNSRSKQWKVWEREGAKDLGGTRTGPRGLGLPDSLDIPFLAPEFKYQQKLSLRRAHLEQAQRNCEASNKDFWELGIREAKTGTRVAVIDWQFFVQLFRSYIESV